MNKKRVVWIVLNVIVVLALLMAGCGAQTATPTPEPVRSSNLCGFHVFS